MKMLQLFVYFLFHFGAKIPPLYFVQYWLVTFRNRYSQCLIQNIIGAVLLLQNTLKFIWRLGVDPSIIVIFLAFPSASYTSSASTVFFYLLILCQHMLTLKNRFYTQLL